MSDGWYEDDYDYDSDEYGEEMDENEPNWGFARNTLYPAAQSNPLSVYNLKSSLSALDKYHQFSRNHKIKYLATEILGSEGLTMHTDKMWLSMANPIYHSFDDYHLYSSRRGQVARLWASKWESGHREAEYYIRHPESMNWPLVHSMHSILWDYPFQEVDFFDEDMEETLAYIQAILTKRKAKKAHKKRHQTRGKAKTTKKKSKTAAEQVAAPPVDTDEEMDVVAELRIM
eukprot:gene12557-14521_t